MYSIYERNISKNKVVFVDNFLGLGSGFWINDEYILTNHHVVGDAKTVTVTLPDKTQIQSEEVIVDEFLDLALIKIKNPPKHDDVTFNCNIPDFGENLYTIGHSYGWAWHFSPLTFIGIAEETGDVFKGPPEEEAKNPMEVLLGPHRMRNSGHVFPGNSGGPIFNMSGDVVGVVTVTILETNINGAISSEDVCFWLDKKKVDYDSNIWGNVNYRNTKEGINEWLKKFQNTFNQYLA